jgi:hypothetical protein
MADQNITVKLKVEADAAQAQGSAEKLRNTLREAADAAKSSRTGGGGAAMASSQPVGAQAVMEYGQQRGAAGATGAAARDFANQSQALGGLVRLYATYAANIFAVSAAFSSLREAMNTSMMIKGLDQLGAASGIAMGGIAKDFAAASDGALSLRESMEATTKALSSGLSKDQLMQIGQVAKSASQALGVNMSDAVSRLTRGITKLEPELLDELGIFTKTGKAAEDYARSIGKAESQLTDFERRQAFANAVLKEGTDKFSNIKIEGNPYDQLIASLKNVAQSILEVVNKIVAPVAKLLADNVELIGLAIGVAALKITKQALPALSNWRSGLAQAAEEAAKNAQRINTAFGEAFVEREAKRARIPQLEQELAQTQAGLATSTARLADTGMDTRKIASLQQQQTLEQRILATKTEALALEQSANAAERSQAVILREQLVLLERQQVLMMEKAAAWDVVNQAALRNSRILSDEWQREQNVVNARKKQDVTGALDRLGKDVQEKGFGEGLSTFYSDINANKDLNKIEKFGAKVKGTFVAIATSTEILAGALSRFFFYIEAAVIAYTILDSLLSSGKAKKAIDELEKSLDGLKETTKTAIDVGKLYGNTVSTESVNAVANAFTGVGESISTVAQKFDQARASMGWWESWKDNMNFLGSGDLVENTSSALASGIVGGIRALPEGEFKTEIEAKLRAATGAVRITEDDLNKALQGLSKEGFSNVARQVDQVFKTGKDSLKNTQALTQDVKETSKAVETAYQNLSNSIKDTSPGTTFLLASIRQAESLKKAFKDTQAAAVELLNIQSGRTNIATLGLDVDQTLQLRANAESFKQLNDQAIIYADNISRSKSRIQEIDAEIKTWITNDRRVKLELDKTALETGIAATKTKLFSLKNEIEKTVSDSAGIIAQSGQRQIDELLRQSSLKSELAKIGSQKAQVGAVPVKTQASIRISSDLERRSIEIERALFKSNENLVRSTDLLTIQMQRASDLKEIELIRSSPDYGPSSEERISKVLQPRVDNADKAISAYSAAFSDPKSSLESLSRLAKDNPALAGLVQSVSGIRAAMEGFDQKLKDVNFQETLAQVSLLYERAASVVNNQIEIAKARLEQAKSVPTTSPEQDENIRGLEKYIQDRVIEKAEVEASKLRATAFATTAGLPAPKMNAVVDSAVAQAIRGSGPTTAVTAALNEVQAPGVPGAGRKGTAVGTPLPRSGKSTLLQQTIAEIEREASATKEVNTINNQTNQAVGDRNQLLKDARLEEEKILRTNQSNLLIINQQETREQNRIKVAREELSIQSSMGLITADELTRRTILLDRQDEAIESAQKLRDIEESRRKAQVELQEKVINGLSKESQEYKDQQDLINKTYSSGISAIKEYGDQHERLRDLQTSMNDRTKSYMGTFKTAFDGMADSILKFVETGKGGFKDLFKTMITELIKYELRQQASMAFRGVSPLLQNFGSTVGRFIGGGSSSVSQLDIPVLGLNATGNVYDSAGIQKFAQGGMFTNSIVNSPTVFKFAKGTGLMGEAGPEAIVPLKRDENGNLGIRSSGGGGSTEVVINNYSSQPATTKETTDSRGNRRVEVIVGEMTAGEINRNGSSSQRAIRSTFGLQPQLIRR